MIRTVWVERESRIKAYVYCLSICMNVLSSLIFLTFRIYPSLNSRVCDLIDQW